MASWILKKSSLLRMLQSQPYAIIKTSPICIEVTFQTGINQIPDSSTAILPCSAGLLSVKNYLVTVKTRTFSSFSYSSNQSVDTIKWWWEHLTVDVLQHDREEEVSRGHVGLLLVLHWGELVEANLSGRQLRSCGLLEQHRWHKYHSKLLNHAWQKPYSILLTAGGVRRW